MLANDFSSLLADSKIQPQQHSLQQTCFYRGTPITKKVVFKNLSFSCVKFACQSSGICISSAGSSCAPVSTPWRNYAAKLGVKNEPSLSLTYGDDF